MIDIIHVKFERYEKWGIERESEKETEIDRERERKGRKGGD